MTETAAKQATSAETKQALADRDFWRAIGAPLNWTLYGWSYRSGATFSDENNRTVEMAAAHVRLLEATAAERDRLLAANAALMEALVKISKARRFINGMVYSPMPEHLAYAEQTIDVATAVLKAHGPTKEPTL